MWIKFEIFTWHVPCIIHVVNDEWFISVFEAEYRGSAYVASSYVKQFLTTILQLKVESETDRIRDGG